MLLITGIIIKYNARATENLNFGEILLCNTQFSQQVDLSNVQLNDHVDSHIQFLTTAILNFVIFVHVFIK